MDSSSAWGSNGLTSVNCGGVWGNSGPALSGGSIWNAGGSGKRASGEVWSGLEIDSKLEGGSRWGSLTSDGSSYRPRNSSPGSNIGASAGPDSDVDPWGRSSGHGSSSSWGSASTSDNKDASGWGSLDPSPVPNAGTEGWGFRPGTNCSLAEGKQNDWKQSGNAKAAPGLAEKEQGSSFLSTDDGGRTAAMGEQKGASPAPFQSDGPSKMQMIWGNCATPVSGSSQVQDAGNVEANKAEMARQSQLQLQQQQQQQVAMASAGAKAASSGSISERDAQSASEALSREEIIRRAVNSTEGWGKIPIRQDTAWNIDDEPKKPFLPTKMDDAPAEHNQQATRDRAGSLSWNQGQELSNLSDKSHAGSTVWGSVVSDGLGFGSIVKETGNDIGSELARKAVSSADKLLLEGSWLLRPAPKEIEWGTSLGLSENLWESGKKDIPWGDGADSAGINKVGAGEPGMQGHTLTRSASASTWSSDEGDSHGWSKGDSKVSGVDKVMSVWGNDSADAESWKPGFKSTTPLPTEALFSVPPPQFGSDGFGGLVGPWGNNAKQGLNVGGLSDNGKPPQMRVQLLQQLMAMGFKKEDAQAALISNNLNMDVAISKLLANQMRGTGVEPDADHAASRRLFQGANHINDLAALSRSDLPPDVAACLVSLLQNSPNASSGSSPHGSHLGGGGAGGAQIQSPATGSVPPFSPNRLGLLSSISPNMLPTLQQKLQPNLRTEGNQAAQVTALQHQLLQQHLLQSVQGAVQAGLIPPELITAQSLTPTVLVKLQQMMEMYQALQELTARYRLMIHENLTLLQSRQRPQNLSEVELFMTSFKQQICATQQQILQELTILQPPPPPSSASGMDQLLKNFAGIQMKDDGFSSAGLMNQWKVGPSGDDLGILGQMASSNSNLQQHSILMSASQADSYGLDRQWMPPTTSCWSRPSELSAAAAALTTGRNDDANVPTHMTYTSATTINGAMPPSVSDNGISSGTTVEDGTSASQLEIAEFIPGKPWQGLASKSAEEDMHLNTVTAAQSSLVLNNEIPSSAGKPGAGSSLSSSSASSTAPGNISDAAQGSGLTGISKSLISNANLNARVSLWSPIDASIASDPWPKNQNAASGLPYPNKTSYQQQQQQQQQMSNRSISWSGGERTSYKPWQPTSPSLPSNWLRLKNIAPQVDNRMLEMLCEQHGMLECFVPNLTRDNIIIKYMKLDDACKAQRLLNLCPLAGQPLVAEFLNKFEVFQLLQQAPANVHSQMTKPLASTTSPFQLQGLGKMAPNAAGRWNQASSASFGGGAANPWGMNAEEHGLYLPNSKHL